MSILLQGGTVLVHQDDDRVEAIQADILISGSIITRVERNISISEAAEVIDCQNKVISPGFIDTHHHVWQTQLKGRHADETLLEFFPSGDLQAASYNPSDVFWGQLAGCLEALDAGTTTVVDHAHVNYSPEHCKSPAMSSHHIC
jgi:cytosine/adenosine deaminase-related metal-dependent hydrolase